MSTDQNQTDPYAELKTAWEAGRRIRVKYQRGGWDQWRTKGVDGSFCWNEKPECYEIEPLPADKWAKEKTAHAQGKRIEMLISDDEYGPERWSFCELPDWHDRCEYRIAPDPDPAPAGKTDEQLGEIGKAAAKCTVHWSQINTAFAAAVREAVEKEQAEEIEKLKNAHAMEFVCLNKVLPINRDGSVKIVDHAIATVRYLTTASAQQAEEIARLTAELEIFKKIRDSKLELQSKYDDLQVTMDSVTMNANWSIERMKEAEHKLATIEVRLGEIAALPQKWRSRPAVMSWNPAIDCIFELEAALLPRPTAEAVSKADFERFARGEGYSLAKNAKDEFRDTAAIHGWKLWQAARAAKEGEK